MNWMTAEDLEDDSETRTRSQRDNGNKDVQQLGEKVLGDHVGRRDKRAISRDSSWQVTRTLCVAPTFELSCVRWLAQPAVARQVE